MNESTIREAFDRFVEPLDAAALIVTIEVGDERSGCLVGFHSQCSIEPPLLAVWLSPANHTFGVATEATHMGVHVLGDDERDLAELFGGETGDEVDKFARCEWQRGAFGVPLLAGALRRGVFAVMRRHSLGGDHELYVLAPVAIDGGGDDAALMVNELDVEPGHPVPPER